MNKRNETEKPKAGRKNKYYTDVLPRFDDIEKMCNLGYSDIEIMDCLGIKKTAFYKYLNEHKEFAELIKTARKAPILEVKSALLKRATGFKVSVNTVSIDADGNETITTKEQYFAPDPASIMIILKHWDKDPETGAAKWTNDPAQLELRKREIELKEKELEKNNW